MNRSCDEFRTWMPPERFPNRRGIEQGSIVCTRRLSTRCDGAIDEKAIREQKRARMWRGGRCLWHEDFVMQSG